jgi:hypothetical protein
MITGWEECAEYINQALGPLDDAQRAVRVMIPVARGLGESDAVEEIHREVERVQHEVATLRAKFDELAETSSR